MKNQQRMKSDFATMDKRDAVDKNIKEDRIRNDELTMERRSKADKTMDDNRLRNDELTANRRETKDGNIGVAFLIFFAILAGSAVGAYFTFM